MEKNLIREDPVIDRVRKTRHEISARFGHDPDKLTAYYIERQQRHKDRLICTSPAKKPDSTSLQ